MPSARRQVLSFAVATAMLATAGCIASPGEEMDVEDAALGDAIAAVALSAPSTELANGIGGGRVVLIDADGQLRTLKTSGMDVAQLDWDERGLYFADQDHDYRLAEELHVTDSAKAAFQVSMFAIDGGSVGVFNDGFVDDGYAMQVVDHDDAGSRLHTVEGNYLVTGLCDGVVFGIGEPTGIYRDQALGDGLDVDGSNGFAALMLSQLSGTTGGAEDVITIRGDDESDQSALDAPCRDGALHHLATIFDGDDQIAVLRSWDITTGEMSQQRLRDSDGSPMSPTSWDDDPIQFDGYTRQSLSADGTSLTWVGTDSRVMSTDIATGSTQHLYSLPGTYTYGTDDRSVTFTEDTLAAITWNQEAGEATYIELDRTTGETRTSLSLPELGDALTSGPTSGITGSLYLRDLAIEPRR